jgi:hypothetical protein
METDNIKLCGILLVVIALLGILGYMNLGGETQNSSDRLKNFTQDFQGDEPEIYSIEQLNQDWYTPEWSDGVEEQRVGIGIDGSGNRVLCIKEPAGQYDASRTGAIWPLCLRDTESIDYEYKVKFSEGFDFAKEGKLNGVCGGTCNTGGHKPNGIDGFSVRTIWKANGTIAQYIYHPDQADEYGSEYTWTNITLRTNVWYTLRTHVQLNTPRVKDGVVTSYLDGKKVFEKTNLQFRDTPAITINTFKFEVFHGGSTPDYAPLTDGYVCFDDFKIY